MSRGGMRCGAGRPRSRATTAGKLAVDARRLHRDGHLAGCFVLTWRWSSGAEIQIETSLHDVKFTYSYRERHGDWREVRRRVNLTRTPCRYGGERPWFICPRCTGRVAILYLWNVPACRKCAKLVYPSQAEDAAARSWRRTRKIMARLGQGADASAVPHRPAGMREATYARLWAAWAREEQLRDDMLAALAARLALGL